MGSALHEAALHGKLEVVKLLLDHGIDINLCDREGRTALQLLSAHQAQQKSFTEITQAIKGMCTLRLRENKQLKVGVLSD